MMSMIEELIALRGFWNKRYAEMERLHASNFEKQVLYTAICELDDLIYKMEQE